MESDVCSLVAELCAVSSAKKTNLRLITRDFHLFVRDNHAALAANITEVLEQLQPDSYSQKMFRAQLIDKFQVSSEVIGLLQQNDDRSVAQALRCKWFFRDLRDPSDFLDILPQLSYRTRTKVLNKFGEHLNDSESAEVIYKRLRSTYGPSSAIPILPACNENFIKNELLSSRQRLPKHVLSLTFRKHPLLFVEIIKHRKTNSNTVWSQYSLDEFHNEFSRLRHQDMESYMELTSDVGSCGSKLGRRITKRLIDKISSNYEKYSLHVKPKYFLTRLSLQEFQKWYSTNVLPPCSSNFPGFFQSQLPYLKYMRKDKYKLDLFFTSFKMRYGRELNSHEILFKIQPEFRGDDYFSEELKRSLFENLESELVPKLHSYWLKYMLDEHRILWIEENIRSITDPLRWAEFYARGPLNVYMTKLEKLIESRPNPDDRLKIAQFMIDALAFNKCPPSDVTQFFTYLVKRFRNEKLLFLGSMLKSLHKLEQQLIQPDFDWTSLNDLINIVRLNGAAGLYLASDGVTQYFHYRIFNASNRNVDVGVPLEEYAEILMADKKDFLDIYTELWDACEFVKRGSQYFYDFEKAGEYERSKLLCRRKCLVWFMSQFDILWRKNSESGLSEDIMKRLLHCTDKMLDHVSYYNRYHSEGRFELPDWGFERVKTIGVRHDPVLCYNMLKRYCLIGYDPRGLDLLKEKWVEWQENEKIDPSWKIQRNQELVKALFDGGYFKIHEAPEWILEYLKHSFSTLCDWSRGFHQCFEFFRCQNWFVEYVKSVILNEIPIEELQICRLDKAVKLFSREEWMTKHLQALTSTTVLPNKESMPLALTLVDHYPQENWVQEFFKRSAAHLDEDGLKHHANAIAETLRNHLKIDIKNGKTASLFWGYDELKLVFPLVASPSHWMVWLFLHEEPNVVMSVIRQLLGVKETWWENDWCTNRERSSLKLLTHVEMVEFCEFIRLLDVFEIPQEVSKICLEKVNMGLGEDYGKENGNSEPLAEAVKVLSLLLQPAEFLTQVSKYIPESSKVVEYNSSTQILYDVQTAVCQSFQRVLAPLETLMVLREFAMGDFLKLVANGPLIRVALSVPERKILPLLREWLNSAVSLRKHVFKLIFTIAPLEFKESTFSRIVAREKNVSLRLVLFNLLKTEYLLDPNDVSFAPFMFLVSGLTPEDVDAVKSLITVDGFADQHIPRYIELLWKLMGGVLKEFLPEGKQQVMDLVIQSEKVLKLMSEGFLRTVLRAEFSRCLPSSYPPFVAQYLSTSPSMELEKSRFDFAMAPLISIVKTSWSKYSFKGGHVFNARKLVRNVVCDMVHANLHPRMLSKLKETLLTIISPENVVFEAFLIDLVISGGTPRVLVERYLDLNRHLGSKVIDVLASGIQCWCVAKRELHLNVVLDLIICSDDSACKLVGIKLIGNQLLKWFFPVHEFIIKEHLLVSDDPVIQFAAHELFQKLEVHQSNGPVQGDSHDGRILVEKLHVSEEPEVKLVLKEVDGALNRDSLLLYPQETVRVIKEELMTLKEPVIQLMSQKVVKALKAESLMDDSDLIGLALLLECQL